jgi:hypothetical protein
MPIAYGFFNCIYIPRVNKSEKHGRETVTVHQWTGRVETWSDRSVVRR